MGKAAGSKLSIANIKKTYYYLKKNGLSASILAIQERMQKGLYEDYCYTDIPEEEIRKQKNDSFENPVTFSILVPAFETNPVYFKELLQSVMEQTYPHWELLIADASKENGLEGIIQQQNDERIRYIKLEKNLGISGNSNEGLRYVTGDYVALLDHDDLLTRNALYENAYAIEKSRQSGRNLQLIYSDEDKCDETGTQFYEVYYKQDFNLELLLSNNYFCHLMVMKKELIQKHQFRCNFDGSQDYDLVLRGVSDLLSNENEIFHIPKVLYHWRCHLGSTAVNPQSKQYAYEAGARAIQDFLQVQHWNGVVKPLPHLGFFEIAYIPDVFTARQDVGIVGGKILNAQNEIISGIYNQEGNCKFLGLKAGFSGYMHQASLNQDAFAVDIRCIRVRKELWPLVREITGISYQEKRNTGLMDITEFPTDTNWEQLSIQFSRAVASRGFRILWMPQMVVKWNRGKRQ